jgi:UDP-2-acetamido-3-amino-2,3-dideoxy-glucuronate N-acetyltransferase
LREAPARWPRVAVVGCGYWGKNLVRNFAELGALGGLVDSSEERTAELIAKHGGRAMSFEEALASEEIGALAIATPGPSHHQLALAALEAGKPVYVEKPLTLSAKHAEELVARADAWGLTLMVGHILRHHPGFAHFEKMALEGVFGRVRHVTSTRLALGKILHDEDALWALAPHDLSMVTGVLGQNPTHVRCVGDSFLRPGIVDMARIHLTYPDNVSAEVRVSWLSPFKEQKFTIVGEAAFGVFDDTLPWDQKIGVRRAALDWHNPAPFPDQGVLEHVPLPPGEPLKAECRNFLDAVATGVPPRTDGREGLAVIRLLERARASMAEGGVAK